MVEGIYMLDREPIKDENTEDSSMKLDTCQNKIMNRRYKYLL